MAKSKKIKSVAVDVIDENLVVVTLPDVTEEAVENAAEAVTEAVEADVTEAVEAVAAVGFVYASKEELGAMDYDTRQAYRKSRRKAARARRKARVAA